MEFTLKLDHKMKKAAKWGDDKAESMRRGPGDDVITAFGENPVK